MGKCCEGTKQWHMQRPDASAMVWRKSMANHANCFLQGLAHLVVHMTREYADHTLPMQTLGYDRSGNP